MKRIVLLLALLIGMGSMAQEPKKNFVISTSNPEQVPVIIKTANQLVDEFDEELGEVQIVLYGKAVKELADAKVIDDWFAGVTSDKIHFFACSLALEKTKTDKTKVSEKVQIVANAYVHILKLKTKGYIGIEP